MALKVVMNRSGGYYLSGLRNDFAAYERKIIQGRIPCPFMVEFRDSKIVWVETWNGMSRIDTPTVPKQGSVVTNRPVPLTPAGNPKIRLF